MKKAISLFVIVMFAVTMLAGCGQAGTPTSTTASATTQAATQAETTQAAPKLSGKIVMGTNRTDKAADEIGKLAKDFMAANPGTEVEIEGIKDIDNILKVRVAAGEEPDITPVLDDLITSDKYPDYFVPLDDIGFLTPDKIYYYEQGLGPDKKFYAYSHTVSYCGIVYSKAAFKNAGIDTTPKTMDEFLAACEKLKAKSIIPFASNFKDGWPLNNFICSQFEYEMLGNTNYRVDLVAKDEYIPADDGGNIAGLKFLRTLKDKGYLEPDLMSTSWDGMKKDMAAGKFGMAYLGDWFPPQLVDNGAKIEDIGMFPLPGAKLMLIKPDWKFAVSKNSKNVELAKAFFKYVFEDGKYEAVTGVSPNLRGVKVSNPCIDELISSGLPAKERAADNADYEAIVAKAQIEQATVVQDYLTSKNPDDVVKNYNKKWADAKKALGK